jgi:trk system potassium uptake protein TrkH
MDRNSIKNILKFLSLVGIIVIAFFTIPLVIGIIYKENITYFSLFLFVFFLFFATILIYLKNHQIKMKIKEAILSVNLVWFMIGTLGQYHL